MGSGLAGFVTLGFEGFQTSRINNRKPVSLPVSLQGGIFVCHWDLGSYRSCREVHGRTKYLRQFQGCLGNAQDPEAANSTRGSGISRKVVNVCKCRTIKIHPCSHIRRNTCSNCCRVVCINNRKLRTLQKMLRIPLQLPIDRPSRSISRATGRLIVGRLKL